ncbi:5-hydroxytryptamine receptor 3A-like [Acanthochromis polyacanthus]|uniref:5-hydroxytryptamine receptor 3A-like n=1 Tax=Acanthochromis polyacanthus TaxID=80966 RepID=UPI002233EA22|nr:5-hydroxytryptamine receptor 3A-like [Acanthochromis polyacanthus]
MMLTGFFFFLPLLTGLKTSDSEQQVPDGHEDESNLQLEENPGGNTSSLVSTGLRGNETGGNTSSLKSSELHGNETGDEANSDYKCSFQAIFDHLNLTENKTKYTMSRPVKNHTTHTDIHVYMAIYAILDVRESDQTLVSNVRIFLEWDNEHIQWNSHEFCHLEHIMAPTEYLWMPDLTIKEMTEKNKIRPNPNLRIDHRGFVEYRDDQVVVSTCKMHIFKFPFDTQTCNFSFKSVLYSDKEVKLSFNKNNEKLTNYSRKVMLTQYEWLFVNLTSTSTIDDFDFINQTVIVYSIIMKRRSVLYVVNFLLPVLVFLCLDLASLLISNRGGEKLSFKVTVLLAVTVMQLILNEILPASSHRIPLIAIYCIGVFGMMLLSLMETIFVMYLMDKDFQDDVTDKDQSLNESREDKLDKGNFHGCFREMKKWTHCGCFNNASADQQPHVDKEKEQSQAGDGPEVAASSNVDHAGSAEKEQSQGGDGSEASSRDKDVGSLQGSSSQLTEVSLALEKVSDELGQIDRKMIELSSSKEEEKPGYWTRMAKKIDKAFSIIYVISVFVFLAVIFSVWIPKPE